MPLSFQGTTHPYLLQLLMKHKSENPLFYLLVNPFLHSVVPQQQAVRSHILL